MSSFIERCMVTLDVRLSKMHMAQKKSECKVWTLETYLQWPDKLCADKIFILTYSDCLDLMHVKWPNLSAISSDLDMESVWLQGVIMPSCTRFISSLSQRWPQEMRHALRVVSIMGTNSLNVRDSIQTRVDLNQ